jgi:hypothetical protein
MKYTKKEVTIMENSRASSLANKLLTSVGLSWMLFRLPLVLYCWKLVCVLFLFEWISCGIPC